MARESQGESRKRGGQAASPAPRKRTFVAMELPPLEESDATADWLDAAEDPELIPTAPPMSPVYTGEPRSFPTLDPDPAAAGAFPAMGPEPAAAPKAFPTVEPGPQEAPARPAREVLFPLLGSAADAEPGGRKPALIPSMSGGDPPSGLFVLSPDGGWRGALRLRGAQLSIRVDPAAGLSLHQPVITVLQLPNNSYVQLYAWVERVAPDCAVLIGVPDPGGLAEVRRLLEWRPRRRRERSVGPSAQV